MKNISEIFVIGSPALMMCVSIGHSTTISHNLIYNTTLHPILCGMFRKFNFLKKYYLIYCFLHKRQNINIIFMCSYLDSPSKFKHVTI